MINDCDGEERLAIEYLGQHIGMLGPIITIKAVIELIQTCPDTILRPYSQNYVTERLVLLYCQGCK